MVRGMKKTALVIMAAGLGSRFGNGIKQLEHVGPDGEILMDYSIYDALQAGFDKIIIIIRRDIEDEFKKMIGDRIAKKADVTYVYQDIDDLPEGFSKPEGRTKPWGTCHAVLAARDVIDCPFCVINADDFYGRGAFAVMHDALVKDTPDNEYFLAGYILGNTLSENGTVTRGICLSNHRQYLIGVHESYKLKRCTEGRNMVDGFNRQGSPIKVSVNATVSMNMWGFTPEFIDKLKEGFEIFLADKEADPMTREFLLPIYIDKLVKQGDVKVKILDVNEKWFGLTYAEDKPEVVERINEMTSEGKYPEKLWGEQ